MWQSWASGIAFIGSPPDLVVEAVSSTKIISRRLASHAGMLGVDAKMRFPAASLISAWIFYFCTILRLGLPLAGNGGAAANKGF
jgi:hypothetical protein